MAAPNPAQPPNPRLCASLNQTHTTPWRCDISVSIKPVTFLFQRDTMSYGRMATAAPALAQTPSHCNPSDRNEFMRILANEARGSAA